MKNISAFLCLLLFVAPRPSLQDSPVNKLIEVLFEMAINQIQYKAKPDIKQVQFWLITSANFPEKDEILPDLSNLQESSFDDSKKTYFLVHGWNTRFDYTWSTFFRSDLLDDSDCNIFGIDWSRLEDIQYMEAAETAITVGTYIGEFINNLIDQTNLTPGQIHAIGHSLGAHAIGHLGREVYREQGIKIDRISALDPAKPWFDIHPASLRVNRNDADWVDVLHTNSGPFLKGGLSLMEPLGHVDFYPNGGEHQPGCSKACLNECNEKQFADIIKGGCSHSKAYAYYQESIRNPTGFMAKKCNSWEDYLQGCSGESQCFGHHCRQGEGSYYFEVNASPPYASN